jgi:hypothetical protein
MDNKELDKLLDKKIYIGSTLDAGEIADYQFKIDELVDELNYGGTVNFNAWEEGFIESMEKAIVTELSPAQLTKLNQIYNKFEEEA